MIKIKKKLHKYNFKTNSYRLSKNYKIKYGNFGIKSIGNGLITFRTVEHIRRKLSKQLKKLSTINKTKIFIRLYNWKPYTHKPLLSRMGKGCGPVNRWKTFIRKGMIFIELSTLENKVQIKKIFRNAIKNFPFKIVLIEKNK